jgi:hypothetical protein
LTTLSFLVVPLAGSLASSLLVSPNYVPGRSDQLVFPCFVLVLGAGLAGLAGRARQVGGAALWSLLLVAGLGPLYLDRWPPADRALADRLARELRSGDAVLTTSPTRATLEYNLQRREVTPPVFSYPRDTALHLGNQDDNRLVVSSTCLASEADAVLGVLAGGGTATGRVYLALVPGPVNRVLADRFSADRRVRSMEPLDEFRQAGVGDLVVLLRLAVGPQAP